MAVLTGISVMNILSHIQSSQQAHRPQLAVLLDPEKPSACEALLPYTAGVDMLFVGGSTGDNSADFIRFIRSQTPCPIVLFPGNVAQFTPDADALLFLSMLNARTPDVLIEPHIQAATAIRQSGIESIPMGYILIDGGRTSSVEQTTHSIPLSQADIPTIVSTAIAAELLGKQLIYLEAGSGAHTPVSTEIIHNVRAQTTVPLIVGGGIRTPLAMKNAFDAGADIVVIGNHFEQHPQQLPLFVETKDHYVHLSR